MCVCMLLHVDKYVCKSVFMCVCVSESLCAKEQPLMACRCPSSSSGIFCVIGGAVSQIGRKPNRRLD